MITNDVQSIVDVLEELCVESSVPRNIKEKFKDMASSLKAQGEISVKKNKALHDLDEIGDDTNLQPYIRTQIWNLVSMLEKVN
jgi:uncharacterized protein (UPF0147 family)